MSKILIMLHQKISEMVLFGNLSKVPDTEVYKLPYDKLSEIKASQNKSPELKSTDEKSLTKPNFDLESAEILIKKVLEENSLLTESIDYIIVEANYDSPGNFEINESLLLHVLMTFPTSTVIAYSGTPQALANALQYHPRLQVMDKNNRIEEDISNICACLPERHNISVAPRVYSLARLRQEMLEGKSRLRSSTLPEKCSPTLSPDFEVRVRSITSSNIQPLYALRKEQQAPKKEETIQAQSTYDEDVEKIVTSLSTVKL